MVKCTGPTRHGVAADYFPDQALDLFLHGPVLGTLRSGQHAGTDKSPPVLVALKRHRMRPDAGVFPCVVQRSPPKRKTGPRRRRISRPPGQFRAAGGLANA